MTDTEKLKGLLESIALSIEEISGELTANGEPEANPDGDFIRGANQVLRYRLEDLQTMVKEFT